MRGLNGKEDCLVQRSVRRMQDGHYLQPETVIAHLVPHGEICVRARYSLVPLKPRQRIIQRGSNSEVRPRVEGYQPARRSCARPVQVGDIKLRGGGRDPGQAQEVVDDTAVQVALGAFHNKDRPGRVFVRKRRRQDGGQDHHVRSKLLRTCEGSFPRAGLENRGREEQADKHRYGNEHGNSSEPRPPEVSDDETRFPQGLFFVNQFVIKTSSPSSITLARNLISLQFGPRLGAIYLRDWTGFRRGSAEGCGWSSSLTNQGGRSQNLKGSTTSLTV